MEISLAPAHVIGARMRVTPALVAFGRALSMSSAEFSEFVGAEVANNPALELTMMSTDHRNSSRADPASPYVGDRAPTDLATLASRGTRTDRLMADVGALIGGDDRWIAEYIAGDLDSHGILGRTEEQVAADLGICVDRVQRVIAAFRSAISPGLCAVDIRDSLLLHVQASTTEPLSTLLTTIIRDHLEDVANDDLGAIARSAGIDIGTVREAVDFLRRRIPPYPLRDADNDAPAGPGVDVIIRWSDTRHPQAMSIEVIEHGWSQLRVDDLYSDLARRSPLRPPQGVDAASWAGLQAQVRRAQEVLDLVQARTSTLRRVAHEAASQQWRFLRDGQCAHRPLTRAGVAAALGLHESTVSRCVAGKRIRMPDGTVQPMTVLFGGAVAAQAVLSELVREERAALSDAALADRMTQMGYPICRRTVAKYRGLLKIPAQASRQRASCQRS